MTGDPTITPAHAGVAASTRTTAAPEGRSAHPLLAAALAAVLVRTLALLIAGASLALWYPRRNPASRVWDPDNLGGHTLLEHVARIAHRGDAADRWLTGGGDNSSPLYGWMVDAGSGAPGAPPWVVATIISAGAIVAAAVLLRRCLQLAAAPGLDGDATMNAVWLWLLVPTAPLLAWIAPWSLLAALIGATWLAALRGRPMLGGLTAGAALLTHPLGIATLPLLASTRGGHRPRWISIALALTIGAAGITLAGGWHGWSPQAIEPLAIPQGLWNGADSLLVDPVPLRAQPTGAFGDELSRTMLTLVGALLALGLLVLLPATARLVGRGAAACCAVIAVGVLVVPASPTAPGVAALHLAPCALPAVAPIARWVSTDDLRLALTVACSATLFGCFVAIAALWNPLA